MTICKRGDKLWYSSTPVVFVAREHALRVTGVVCGKKKTGAASVFGGNYGSSAENGGGTES